MTASAWYFASMSSTSAVHAITTSSAMFTEVKVHPLGAIDGTRGIEATGKDRTLNLSNKAQDLKNESIVFPYSRWMG